MNVNILNQINHFLFWDVNINELDTNRDSFYIIKRIMTQGDKKDRNVIFEMYPKETIKEVISKTREMPVALKKIWLEIL